MVEQRSLQENQEQLQEDHEQLQKEYVPHLEKRSKTEEEDREARK